jgi:hypothetical protein
VYMILCSLTRRLMKVAIRTTTVFSFGCLGAFSWNHAGNEGDEEGLEEGTHAGYEGDEKDLSEGPQGHWLGQCGCHGGTPDRKHGGSRVASACGSTATATGMVKRLLPCIKARS